MKRIAALFAMTALAGCASLPSSEPPRYDHAQQTMIAPGYPVERVAMPSGFEFADLYVDTRRQEHDAADDQGVAQIEEAGVSWARPTGDTAVATVLHQGASAGSYWQPWLEADGYEFVGDRRFQYLMMSGRYDEVSGDPASNPGAAPECAAGTVMITYSRDRQRRSIFTYTEGLEYCETRLVWGSTEEENLRQRAYRAFGLR